MGVGGAGEEEVICPLRKRSIFSDLFSKECPMNLCLSQIYKPPMKTQLARGYQSQPSTGYSHDMDGKKHPLPVHEQINIYHRLI